MIWRRLEKLGQGLRSPLGRGVPPVDPEPILIHSTPDSLLSLPTQPPARFIAGRPRLASCSGVAWFHGNHLATINLRGNALHSYRFDPRRRRLAPLQTLIGAGSFDMPENLCFSPDGRRLAITNSRDGAVNLYAVDRGTHLVAEDPQTTIRCGGDVNTHGISFSPCSKFLAFTTVDSPGFIRLFRISEAASDGSDRTHATAVQELPNLQTPLKPKGIDFAPDGRFVAVCYAANAGQAPGPVDGGLLCIYRCREAGGIDGRPVSSGGKRLGLQNPDDVRFFADGSHLVVSNQASDSAVIVSVDARTGELGRRRMTLENPEARLSFPHGIGVSRDGRHLAIASYGHDKLTIYAIRSGDGTRDAPAR